MFPALQADSLLLSHQGRPPSIYSSAILVTIKSSSAPALWFPCWLIGTESTCNAGDLQETWVQSLGWEDPLEKEMATHSCILA